MIVHDNRMITIFTPTYNRSKLLERCYEGMKRQSCKKFIWLIVDDGSTDDTSDKVAGWIASEKEFEIRYVYKENGGLHTGYNTAIEQIDTSLCMCVDSDDWLSDDAIETIYDFWNQNGSDDVAGIVALDCYADGGKIGDSLPDERTINLCDLLIGKYRIVNGDRANVVRTECYKSVAPMKTFAGERNFNPHYMHIQISRQYDFLVLNKALKVVEYQTGGMSDSIFRQYLNSPNSFFETRKLYLSLEDTTLAFRFRQYIHLLSSAVLSKRLSEGLGLIKDKWAIPLLLPAGVCLSLLVRFKGGACVR